ncbi:MAG: alpha/beta fold hydrolase [Rhodobacteraceae bacterium]|nr:alpha/beta fold hydrolase [Paracoccaceae bacterium]
MTRELKSDRRGPDAGEAKSAVIFLHGYGADGNDLMGLADPLAPHLPETVFYAPNAPERCVGNPFGYQWFPIPRMDGSSEGQMRASFEQSQADLNAFLDKVLEDEGLNADQLVLLGFSQGTMMSLQVAPRRDPQILGVIGFSGRLIDPEKLSAEAVAKPPILLLHGDADDVVPPASLPEAGSALQEAGFEVYAHVMQGTAHGIAPDGLSTALAFMKQKLGL